MIVRIGVWHVFSDFAMKRISGTILHIFHLTIWLWFDIYLKIGITALYTVMYTLHTYLAFYFATSGCLLLTPETLHCMVFT